MIRKWFMRLMGVSLFLGAIWAIREYGIFDALESLFRDPTANLPSVDINK